MSKAEAATLVRDTIQRDLADEPQTVIRVYETAQLKTDIREYVLTDHLAQDMVKVLERVVDSAKPPGVPTGEVGIWVSGFFGSGKSHFAKIAGHLLADTDTGAGEGARALFERLLHQGRTADDRLAELLQEAKIYGLNCHLVAFDITAQHAAAADRNVGLTFLRTFYQSLGLSSVVAFAERELDLDLAGKGSDFQQLYQQKAGVPWDQEKNLASSSVLLAECLAELLPGRYRTTELAHDSLMVDPESALNIESVVKRLLRWQDGQAQAGKPKQRIVFVVDEVGAWAGRNLDRIDQIRSLVEVMGTEGKGRIWLLATSQERLSAVVQNATIADDRAGRELLQRLEARFKTNVHLEPSEVGTVIQDRILRKNPTSVPSLQKLWADHEGTLRDVAEPPGLELGANYPRADREPFVSDYPFLPYQLQAAADIFGNMRGVRISSGARSMLGVAFDALKSLADRPLGTVVSWDQIFDSANRGNEFADEQYLGSQGLEYIRSADRDVLGTPLKSPSRVLKTLWLAQQTNRIPCTSRNLERLLVEAVDADVLQLEQDVAATLQALETRTFVRQDAGTSQWKFLTQDQVTLEKIASRIAEDLKVKEVRDAITGLYQTQLQAVLSGRLTVGKSNTPFDYGLYLGGGSLKNDKAPVKVKVDVVTRIDEVKKIAEESGGYLEEPQVRWVVFAASGVEDRLRRAMAIERLEKDDEYQRIATERTRSEASRLQDEAAQLRAEAGSEIERVFRGGTLYWGGHAQAIEAGNGTAAGQATTTRTEIEKALRDRVSNYYYRFTEGDRTFNAANIDKLFTAAPSDRATLDPDLGLFDADGHIHGNHVLVEELSAFLRQSTKTAGDDIADHFENDRFGWPRDLLRYIGAAMFVDAKVAAIDRTGRRYDDPRAAGARALFGTQAFKTTRLEVEEDALTPEESSRAQALLAELQHPPTDGGEIALKEATLQVAADLKQRLVVLDRARQVDFPLPDDYDGIGATIEMVGAPASRVKIIRALLAHATELREAVKAITGLEKFDERSGFAQYRRSRELLTRALQAGLADDPEYGSDVQDARDQLDALIEQKRVLGEWEASYQTYRLVILDAFRAVYGPIREELHRRSGAARVAVTGVPEYADLDLAERSQMRVEFLGDGKPLQEVSHPELRDEQQLLAANAEYSIGHMRAVLAALDSQVAAAQGRVIELLTEQRKRKGEAARVVSWKASDAFIGRRFETEADVDAAFDPEKERLKNLVRDGKTIQVV